MSARCGFGRSSRRNVGWLQSGHCILELMRNESMMQSWQKEWWHGRDDGDCATRAVGERVKDCDNGRAAQLSPRRRAAGAHTSK
eukprot:4046371-Prymnesium_polylepis.1